LATVARLVEGQLSGAEETMNLL